MIQLKLRNIGALPEATIDIEGITVIAGFNNTGKSTVGKTLYALLNGMSSWPNLYRKECTVRIENYLNRNSIDLEDWCLNKYDVRRRRTSKASSLQSRFANDEKVRVTLEDFQNGKTELLKRYRLF